MPQTHRHTHRSTGDQAHKPPLIRGLLAHNTTTPLGRWSFFHAGQILELDSDKELTDASGRVVGVAGDLGWRSRQAQPRGARAGREGGKQEGGGQVRCIGGARGREEPSRVGPPRRPASPLPTPHVLLPPPKVYLYLLARFGRVERNRLLMNKGADVLCAPGKPQARPYPAKWWGHDEERGVEKDEHGCWRLRRDDPPWTGEL
jgi:hypothetical protein